MDTGEDKKSEPSAVTPDSRLPPKLVLTAFAAYMPGVEEDPYWITQGLPPFIAHKGCLRIDFVPFMLHRHIVFDGEMFERILHRRVKELEVFQKEMRLLKKHNYLHLEDIGSLLKKKESVLLRMLEHDEKTEISVWAPGVQDAIRGWITVQESLSKAAGDYYTYHVRLPYGVQVALKRRHSSISMEAGLEMILRLLKPYEQWTREDVADARVVAEVYLTVVNQTLLVSRNMGSTWHDWDNVGKLYREKLIVVGEELELETTPKTKLKEFATLAFPEVVPDTPEELIERIAAKEAESLRELVKKAADNKIVLDSTFARNELLAERETNMKVKTVRKIAGYLTLPLALLHLPGHLAGKVLEEGVERVAEHKAHKRFGYLYFLSQRSKFSQKIGNISRIPAAVDEIGKETTTGSITDNSTENK